MQYKILLVVFFLIGDFAYSYCQDSFIKKIDKDMTTLGYQIELYKDRIFILTAKVCNNISECSTVLEIDETGDVLWDKELPFLDVSPRSMVIENDTIFLSGNYNETQRKFFFHQMSVEGGEPLATYDVVKPDDIYTNMFNLGMLKKEDKFYIYGPGKKENGTIESSLIYVVDSKGNLDTLLSFFPMSLSSDPWQMRLDNQGNAMAFMILDSLDFGTVPGYRKIIKLNDDYDIIWEYTSEGVKNDLVTPKAVILDDDRIVYVTGNDMPGSNNTFFDQNSLRAINPDSTISWQYYSPNHPSNHRVIFNVELASDGNIFGFGEWGYKINEPRINQTPWIFKMSTAGDMIWQRAYYEMKADGSEAKYGVFFDAVELDDGSIMAVGGMDTGNYDILIARFDSEGCLMFGCELLNDVTDILSDVEDVPLASGISVHPNPSISGAQVEVSIDAAIHNYGDYIFEVYNAMGELVSVYDLKVGQQSIHIEAGKGLYYVRIKNEAIILYSAKHIIF